MEIKKGKIGQKIKGTIYAKPLRILLREFLSEEEIWGYNNRINKNSLEDEWNGRWDDLLRIVNISFKNRIKYIHPDINDEENSTATHLTTIFNVVKGRLKKKINPETFIEKDLKYRGKIWDQKYIICPCGVEFLQSAPWQKYHSNKCYAKYRNRIRNNISDMRNCKWCGNEFPTNRGFKYCSDECKKNALNYYQKNRNKINSNAKKPDKIQEICFT